MKLNNPSYSNSRRRTKKRALIMITMAWIGASMWFIPVLGWNQILRKGPSQLPGDYANSAILLSMSDKDLVRKAAGAFEPSSL